MSNIDLTIRIAGIVNDSIVDGPGLRLTIFTQGCTHYCKGCQNPHTHDPNGGEDILISDILKQIDKNPLLDGVTFSGGEPFIQADALIHLAEQIKSRKLSLIIYTGYLFEYLFENESFHRLLKFADIIIDGKFIEDEKTLDQAFAGSKNQRIIDVKKSLQSGLAEEIYY